MQHEATMNIFSILSRVQSGLRLIKIIDSVKQQLKAHIAGLGSTNHYGTIFFWSNLVLWPNNAPVAGPVAFDRDLRSPSCQPAWVCGGSQLYNDPSEVCTLKSLRSLEEERQPMRCVFITASLVGAVGPLILRAHPRWNHQFFDTDEVLWNNSKGKLAVWHRNRCLDLTLPSFSKISKVRSWLSDTPTQRNH